MNNKIPSDSTIASIWHLLDEPVVYMGGVRQKLTVCLAQNGNAKVTIGVTGGGFNPCFRITYQRHGEEKIFGSFWYNHKPLDRQDAVNQNWSTESMTAAEVAAFAREKTGR